MTLLIVGLALFLGVHLLPAWPALRANLAGRLGEPRYRALFSLASFAGLLLIVAGFAHAGAQGRVAVYAPLPAARVVAPIAMIVSFVLFAAANMPTHLRRVLRHPMLLGLILWSLVHLLANGDRRGLLLFGGFLAYALVDLASAISRNAVKSFVPQAKYDAMAIVGGGVVALLVMTLHRWLFGVAVVPFGV